MQYELTGRLEEFMRTVAVLKRQVARLDELMVAADATVAQAEQLAVLIVRREEHDEAGESEQGCQHPPAQRVAAATMGHPYQFVCRQCDQVIDPHLVKVDEVCQPEGRR